MSADPENQQDYEFERTFGWLVHDVHSLMMRVWERYLRDSHLGLSQPQARVVANVFRQQGLTQTELAVEVEMQRAPLGRLLDRMEEAGWITRHADPEDRRIKRIYCTAKVSDVMPKIHETARALFATALDGLSSEEITGLIEVMGKLKTNLTAAATGMYEGSQPLG